jgi:hypothetical protein
VIAGGGLGFIISFVTYISYYQNPFSKRAGQCRGVAEERRDETRGGEELL